MQQNDTFLISDEEWCLMKSFRKTCKAFGFWLLLCETTFSTWRLKRHSFIEYVQLSGAKISDSLAWNLLHQAVAHGLNVLFLSPLFGRDCASFPQTLWLSRCPAVPNPILESHELQSFSLLLRIPILAVLLDVADLKSSWLQFVCSDAC